MNRTTQLREAFEGTMRTTAMIMIIIATISTNTAANIVSPTNVFQNAAPKLINEDRGVIITGLMWLSAPSAYDSWPKLRSGADTRHGAVSAGGRS